MISDRRNGKSAIVSCRKLLVSQIKIKTKRWGYNLSWVIDIPTSVTIIPFQTAVGVYLIYLKIGTNSVINCLRKSCITGL